MKGKLGTGNWARLAAILIAVTSVLRGAPADLDQARKYYDLTEFEESLKVLHGIPQRDAAVYELLGRDYFMLGEYKKASDALEKAVAAEPRNSDYMLWLGGGYGRKGA